MRLMRVGTLLALAFFGVTGGPGPAWAISDAQRAYNACTKYYNSTFRSLPGNKAIVAGLSSNGSWCFWRYNSTSEAQAINSAMSDCRRAWPQCFLYNSNGKNTQWVARISNMGGDDGTRTRSSSGSGGLKNALDAATAVLGGVAAARSGGGGGTSIPKPSGYSQKGAFDDCAAVYRAAGQTALADKCASRSSNMGSLR